MLIREVMWGGGGYGGYGVMGGGVLWPYPAGKLRTAARVPVVRSRRIGCPVTRLFHEYGSASRVPGVTGGGGACSRPMEPENINMPKLNPAGQSLHLEWQALGTGR